MKLHRFAPFFLSHYLVCAVPVEGPASSPKYGPLTLKDNSGQFKRSIGEELRPRRNRNAVETTIHSDGSVIDWIPLDSQVSNGKVASPPPLPVDAFSSNDQPTFRPQALLQSENEQRGPEGTVPVLRFNSNITLAAQQVKAPPIDPNNLPAFTAEAVGDHWYASSAQYVNNRGGSASFSIYKTWTESNSDFSLLQSAVIRTNVPKPGDNSKLVMQTVEAGWYATFSTN